MVPLWFLPFAVVSGNTFILKPSEQVPLSQKRMFELLEKCDLPPGVVNLVNGGTRSRRGDLRSPGHPRRLVRRIDAGRAARLSARHARRQARAGARRREELHRRHARRRLRSQHSGDHRVVLRLRGRALPGRQRAAAGRRGAQGTTRSAGRSGAVAEGRRRPRAGRARWVR